MEMWKTKRFDELKATGQLPSPTGVAMQILKMAQSDDVGVAEVSRLVQGDPALAGRILKLVNSALYAGSRQFTAIPDAVARLGLKTVWQVALGFSVISSYRRGRCKKFSYDNYWSQSLASAVAAQRMARSTQLAQPEEAFTCGLLCQTGRLALACIFPEAYSNVLDAARGDEADLLNLEQTTFALDHRELTGAILQDWGLPNNWVTVARFQEDPDDPNLPADGRTRQLALLMNSSQLFGTLCIAPANARPDWLQKVMAQSNRVRIAQEDLFALCDGSVRDWKNWGSLLDIKTCDVPSMESLPEAAQLIASSNPEDGESSASESAKIRVLVIDPDLKTADAVRACLPPEASIQIASCDADALRLTLEFDPQIILTEWETPGLNGVELCRSLRQTKTGQPIYILVFTRMFDEEMIAAALEAGANEYVMKPIIPRVLEARIKGALRMIGLQQEVLRDKEKIRQNLADMAVLNRNLEQAALTDSLTGLPNHRYAQDRLNEEWAASDRTGSPFTLMILDLDHFKKVNDTYGHDVGDIVLKEAARMLRKPLRATDIVCRIGGEEFLVLCRDTDSKHAPMVAERLRQSIEEDRIAAGGTEIRITISIGVASKNASTPDVQTLMKNADLATYQSKTSGRNRVTVYSASA
ncbi:MAG TPA: diguanylate cyclase [Acidobacteriota bacterium]|nr:diguanylate cyclase [Acidobacteriota bacterium]